MISNPVATITADTDQWEGDMEAMLETIRPMIKSRYSGPPTGSLEWQTFVNRKKAKPESSSTC